MAEMTVQQALDLAARHHQAGRLAQAEDIYRQILAVYANYAPVLHRLGVVRAQAGDYAEAESLISRAIAADPKRAEYRANLGIVLQESGRAAQAVDVYREALALAPNQPEIHNNLANALQQTGDFDAAIEAYRKALTLRPDFIQARFNLANALTNAGDFHAAVKLYRQALEISPDHFEAWLNLGIALVKAGDLDAALDANQRAVALRPASADVQKNLGQVLQKLGRYHEAIDALEMASLMSPTVAEISLDLGNALRESGRLDEAVEAYRRSVAQKPGFADAHYGLSWALLLKGELAEGLREYEWRHRLAEAAGATPETTAPRWDGSALEGKRILLQAEQGFGDTLFALRYLPRIVARGGVVVVRAPSPLVRLFRNQCGIERVVTNEEAVSDAAVQCPMMGLPRLFETRVEDIAAIVPYVTADAELVELWKKRIEGKDPQAQKRVGLVWAGRPTPLNRSIPFPILSPLMNIQDVSFYSLQKGGQAAVAAGSRIANWDARLTDFAHTAALIANLDLVITIDTAVAHLAGAMGKPVWVMLQFAADWRWFTGRTDSPWYPTMRLSRQKTPGDWTGVVEEVTAALENQMPKGC
jgi:tetratricopeptide (TPR) repeat protein